MAFVGVNFSSTLRTILLKRFRSILSHSLFLPFLCLPLSNEQLEGEEKSKGPERPKEENLVQQE